MQLSLLLLLFFFFSFALLGAFGHGKAEDGYHNSTAVIDVGVILDLETWVGKMTSACISMALTDFYAAHKHYSTRIILHARDSKEDVVAASAEAFDLLKNVRVKAIIGPESSAQAEFVAHLGNKTLVPILSFSATSPFLSSTRTPYFIRTAQNDSSQVKAIASIIQAFGWRQVVPIYEDTDFGHGIVPFLTDTLQEIDARVPYRSVIPTSANNDQILEELYKLNSMQTRVFVVHMSFSGLGSRFFSKVKDAGMMDEGYVWITTNGITDFLNSMDSSVVDSMQGVLGVKPFVPKSKRHDDFVARWRKKILSDHPSIEEPNLSTMGLWAYDTVQALAMALEQVGATKSSFIRPKMSKQSATNLVSLSLSEMGPKLLHSILNTQFEGLSGKFHLVDGQLQSSAFEIVNVIGRGRSVGFWTAASGLSRVPNPTTNNKKLSPKDYLKRVLWPGESTDLPRGWVVQTTGKRLLIGVPVASGFSDMLNVTQDDSSGNVNVNGFCKDVFDAARELLPYSIGPYKFLRFENATGGSAGNYNDLVYQVYLQKYDAVVGDTTIIANRSKNVDFTMPYTESGVSMIVPIKEDVRKNPWIFLKPLSPSLWLTSAGAFVFTGLVIWFLEHRTNDEFRGPPTHHLGMMLWFSFSTLVFAHREKMVRNLSRFVVIIWVFVVLILNSSYTASLASILTVQKLQPTITDIKDLIKNGDYVGYKKDSFVLDLLTKRLGFQERMLKPYSSPEEYHDALSKGSTKGGVTAIIDEIPYIKLVLMKYCGRYMMVGPTYQTDGFGFVFPKGSPLVRDFSQAILQLREGEEMEKIEKKWFGFGHKTDCLETSPSVSSHSLTLDSFWALFVITGSASALAVIISIFRFLIQNWHVLTNPDDPETSFKSRLIHLAKHYDYKDLSYHTYKKAQSPVEGLPIGTIGTGATLPFNMQSSQSPRTVLNGSNSIGEESGTSSPEIENPDADASTDVQNNGNAMGGTVEMAENRN